MYRNTGINCLKKISNKNANIIEKYIYNSVSTEDEYYNLLYECIADLYTKDIATVITSIYNRKYGWDNAVYQEYIDKFNEADAFIGSAIDIEEGVLECVCGSKKTISFQKQTRAADEGTTTFAQCVECKRKWKQ